VVGMNGGGVEREGGVMYGFDEVIEKWPLIIARHNSVLVLLSALLETLKATSLINFHVAILVSRLGSQFGWSSNHSSKSMAYISPFDF
jgi:hypothetical protein